MSTPNQRTVSPTERSFRRSLAGKPWLAGLVQKQNMLCTVTSVERYLIVWYFTAMLSAFAVFFI